MKKLSDSVKIAELHTDMQWVKKTLRNHLKHHQRYEIALVTGILLMVVERLFSAGII